VTSSRAEGMVVEGTVVEGDGGGGVMVVEG
jgi:hypothetical protein